MLALTENIFRSFNENKVIYCNWKGTSKIEEGLEGVSDIDVLMSDKDNILASQLLERAGFIKAKTQWIYRFKGIEDWIGMDKSTGKLIHIHLHYRMIVGHPCTMEHSLPWKDEVLSSRILLPNGIYTVSPEWEMLVFLVRIGVEYPNKKIGSDGLLKDSALDEFHYLQGQIERVALEQIITNRFPSVASEIITITKKEILDKSDIAQLRKASSKTLRVNAISNVLYKLISSLKARVDVRMPQWMRRMFGVQNKKTIPSGGKVISFLGQDGSGKSTVTADIEKWLQWKLDVRRFYLGSGEEFYNPWRHRLLKKLNKKTDPLSKGVRSWLYFSDLLASSKYVLKTTRAAKRYAEWGGIALLDRFPQIQYPGINDGPKIRAELFDRVPGKLKWIAECYAKLEEHNIEKAVRMTPDIVIKLMLSPEESLRRKPFENKELVERKHKIIENLSFDKSHVVVIDAEQNYEREIIQIKNIVWNNIRE